MNEDITGSHKNGDGSAHSNSERDGSTNSAPTHGRRHRVVVIGGGNAGLSVAGRLHRMGVRDVAVIEPQAKHVYKPMLSHVAGGTARASIAVRNQRDVTPHGVVWIEDALTALQPEANTVLLASGETVSYDHVIICPGIRQDWDAIPGLADAMRSSAGASNYTLDLAKKASSLLKNIRSGTVIFSQPAGPASCAGAAQKPMYLACDYWRATKVLNNIRVIMLVPDPTVFGIPEVDEELDRKISEYGIELHTSTEMVSVDAASHSIEVMNSRTGASESLAYDILHVEPPQSAPSWIAECELSNASAGGFVDVDPKTLRHSRYKNVWALGDAAATTNSKSGGALRKQVMAVAKNVVAVLQGQNPNATYDGYSVCPFTVSRSTLVFAEFDDQYRLKPTVPFWPGLLKERRLTWVLDRYILPQVYWHMILKGRA